MSQVLTTYSFDTPTHFINFTYLDAEVDTENIDSWFDKKANLENNFPRKNGLREFFQSKTSLGGKMSQVSNTYSFDAPTQFINFTSLDAEVDTENIDSWFDKKANLENNFPGKNVLEEIFQSKTSLNNAKLQEDSITPLRSASNTYYKEEEKEKESLIEHSIPSNACSFLEAEGTISINTPAQPQGRSIRLTTQKDLEQKEKHHAQMKAKRCATPEMISEIPPSKKMKVKKPPEEEQYSVQYISNKNEFSPEKTKGRHNRPCVPPVRQKILKITEKQELEKRTKMQQKVVERWKMNEESKKLALEGAGQLVKKSVSQVTKPVDFYFCTDKRIKQHPKNQEEYKEVNFIFELRKYPPFPARVTKGCTIMKPFNLSQGKKKTFDEAASTYVPLAQQVEAYHKGKLDRYHLRSK
jgi:targeting protein for Xklp2